MAARAPTGRPSRAGGRRNRRKRHRGARKSGRSPPAYGMAARMAKAGSDDKHAHKAKAKTGTKKAHARPDERPPGPEPHPHADLVPETGRHPFRTSGFHQP